MPAVRAVSGSPSAVRGLPTSGRAWMLPGAGEANSTPRRVLPGAGSRMRRSGAKALARAGQSIASIQHTGRGGSLAVVACVEEAREEFLPAIQGGTFKPTEMEQTLWSAESAGSPAMMKMVTQMEKQLSETVSTTRPEMEGCSLVEKLEALSGSGWAILNDSCHLANAKGHP